MRFKSNKGTNQTRDIREPGEYIPHVAHGILKKMRLVNYNSTGKQGKFIHAPDVELLGNSGGPTVRDGHE